MKKLEILGMGCAKCNQLEERTKEAVKELGVDAEVIKKVSEETNEPPMNVEHRLVSVSLDIRSIPDELLSIIGDKATWKEVESLVREPIKDDFLMALKAKSTQLKLHFEKIKKNAEKAERHLTEANLRLVVSVAKKYGGHAGAALRRV